MSAKGYTIRDRRRVLPDGHLSEGAPAEAVPVRKDSWGLFATPRTTGQEDAYRPRILPSVRTKGGWLSDFDWRELVIFSQQLFAQMPNVATAISEKNVYAVGDAWRPHYKGRNAKWGQAAEEWLLHEWYPNCDVRGGVFDFQTNLFLSGLAWDVDGDDCMILTEDENGLPKLKFVDALCIGNGRYRKNYEVGGGAYDGAKICNGILTDRNGAFLGVNVLGEDRGGDDDLLVGARDCQLMFEPEFRALHRGVPRMAKAILDSFDLQDIDGFLKRIIKRYATIAALHSTETGEPPPGSDGIEERTTPDGQSVVSPPGDVRIQRVVGGEDYFLSAPGGEKLEAFSFTTPSPNTENFINRIERRSIGVIGWSYDLLDPAKLKGACVRLVQDRARHAVWKRQRSQKIRARRAVQYAVAKGMARGRIPKNYDGGDFLLWTFNLPAQLTVDAGYDEQSDRENFKAGTMTMAAICEKKGRFWKDTRNQRLLENKDLIEKAIALVAHAAEQGETLTFREAIDLMQQHGTSQRVETLDPAELEQTETEK